MNNSEFQNNEEEASTEERVKRLIGKLRIYINRLQSRKWKFLIANVIVLLLSGAYLLFISKSYYTSSITILPEYGSKASMGGNLSSLASLAGINIGGEGPSTEIYANLIISESILEPVVYSKFKTEKYPDSINLIDYFEIEEDEGQSAELRERERFLAMMKELSSRISSKVDRTTKILELTVTMPESKLSADAANKIVASLDYYIRTQRKSFATEQSYYLEQRIGQVKDSLRIAEERYRDFADKNRGFLTSPTLMVDQGRLQREVEIQQAVYVEITKQYELVQIEKIKDTPVLNVREEAKDPIKKTGPKRAIALIGIMFFSAFLSASYFMFKDEIAPYIKLLKENR